jgi:hopene-associated glycosyltransferase HpnB
MSWLPMVAAASLALWLYLLLGHGGFWRARPRIEKERLAEPPAWPRVVAIVPARDKADHVGAALRSLLAQDYPGELAIVLVEDHSADRPGEIARRLAGQGVHRLDVIEAAALPFGWSGKLWALAQGLRHAALVVPDARHVLFTDVDIAHAPGSVVRLVAKAETQRLDLVSLMVRLPCARFRERLLIPPFVFFFQKLYPFAAVNDPSRRAAAAAGGCMLVRREALRAAGGIEAIRDRLIDDVALAQVIKRRPGGGRIWLGLSTTTVSLRGYDRLRGVWNMVARSADTQLGHSLTLLIATVLGMALVYLVPPTAVVVGALLADWLTFGLGVVAVSCMAACYRPTAKLYGLRRHWILTLPAAAVLYIPMTVDSAIRHRRGIGGRWKGRVFQPAEQGRPGALGRTAGDCPGFAHSDVRPAELGRLGCPRADDHGTA